MDDDERRRLQELCSDRSALIAVAVLTAQDRPLTLNDLTKAVVRHESGASITEVESEAVTAIEETLASDLVPFLADRNFVEYDEQRDLVEPGERLSELEPFVADEVSDDPELELPLDL